MNRPGRWFNTVALATAIFLIFSTFAAWADEPPAQPATPRAATTPAPQDRPAPPATSPGGWYAGASAGAVFAGGLSNQAFTVGNPATTASAVQGFSLGSGPSVGVQGGYQFDAARLEGEFLWQSYGRSGSTFTTTVPGSTPTTFTVAGTDVSTLSGFLNGYYDFHTQSRFSPYLGAGIGVTWVDAGVRSGPNGLVRSPGISQSAFGYQAKAGLSYRMSDQTSAFLQYRFTGTTGFHYGGATVTAGGQTFSIQPATGGLSNHAVELGVRVKL